MPKVEKSKILFDSDVEEEVGFKTNEKYAKHYNEFRKKEILSHGELKRFKLQKFTNNQRSFQNLVKNLEEESSSDDDASTDEELVNPEFDEEFFKTLAFLKNNDPSKYEKIPNFFENVQPVEEVVKSKQKKEKIITVADHQRERLLKTGGVMSDDEEEKHPEELSYTAEQEKIRNDLKRALNDSSESDDEGNFFKVRNKTDDEIRKEQIDYEEWLKSQDSKEIKPLKDFWTNNKLSKEDKFLRDYILKQRYISKGDEDDQAIQQDIIALSDDEAELEKQTEYEHKYNFRFEEPDNEFIKRFPRTVEDSVRVEKSNRKEKRKEREERKAKEKEIKMKELRELQNIRKREIEEKLLLLKDVAGNDNLHEVLQEDDLNSDFDPDEHDKRMSKIFNDEYYGIDEGDQKPEFPDIDEELKVENWDNFDKDKIRDDIDYEPHCEDDDFIMDCDYDPEEEKKLKLQNELIELSKGRKRKKKVSKLVELIKREKPVYEPSLEKTYAEYLDEYYSLDYEDIIGDQPCRFKYTECVPNDFGLTVEEILMASNKELNQWASLKKTMQNRPKNVELNDVEKYNRMRNNLELKKKIFKSIYGEQIENESGSDVDDEKKESDIKKNEQSEKAQSTKTKKKKKKKKTSTVTSGALENANESESSLKSPNTSNDSQKAPIAKSSPQKVHKNTPQSTQTLESSINKKAKKRKLENDSNEKLAKKIKAENKVPETNGEIFKDKKLKKPKANKIQSSPAQSIKLQSGMNIVQFRQRGFKNKLDGNTIGDNRLKAFGINPKKFYGKQKYGKSGQQSNKKFKN